MANLNLNKVILGGRLTADPELKTTQSGISVLTFYIAINRKVGKDKPQEADFISLTAWNKTAEFINTYFRKGSSICVVGSLQVRKWEDNNGQKRYSTEVVVDEAMFVDSKNEAQGTETGGGGNYIPDAYKPQETANLEDVGNDESFLPF
jgi:single-strand DNA-binding protein